MDSDLWLPLLSFFYPDIRLVFAADLISSRLSSFLHYTKTAPDGNWTALVMPSALGLSPGIFWRVSRFFLGGAAGTISIAFAVFFSFLLLFGCIYLLLDSAAFLEKEVGF